MAGMLYLDRDPMYYFARDAYGRLRDGETKVLKMYGLGYVRPYLTDEEYAFWVEQREEAKKRDPDWNWDR